MLMSSPFSLGIGAVMPMLQLMLMLLVKPGFTLRLLKVNVKPLFCKLL